MPKLTWDGVGEKRFETGVDQGVLYPISAAGVYDTAFPWNGLTTVTESPSGAEVNKQYADNITYAALVSAEEFGGTIEAFTFPTQFGECDGTKMAVAGVEVAQQSRKAFGLSYRTKVGNDVAGQDLGYKLHLVWGALATPSEKQFTTVNDSPEAMTFSWEFTTSPVNLTQPGYKPTSLIVIDSTKVTPAILKKVEDAIYGTSALTAKLPTPSEIITMVTTP